MEAEAVSTELSMKGEWASGLVLSRLSRQRLKHLYREWKREKLKIPGRQKANHIKVARKIASSPLWLLFALLKIAKRSWLGFKKGGISNIWNEKGNWPKLSKKKKSPSVQSQTETSSSICNEADRQQYALQKSIYPFDREREWEREKGNITQPLVHYPSGYDSQIWIKLKAGTQNFLLVSHVSVRVPTTWAIFCCFPMYVSRELDLKRTSWDFNQYSNIGHGVANVTGCTAA